MIRFPDRDGPLAPARRGRVTGSLRVTLRLTRYSRYSHSNVEESRLVPCENKSNILQCADCSRGYNLRTSLGPPATNSGANGDSSETTLKWTALECS